MPIPGLPIIFVILQQLADVSYCSTLQNFEKRGGGTKKQFQSVTPYIDFFLLNFILVCEIKIINYTSTLNGTLSYMHIKYMLA
jgi:hypothetical protein